MYYWEKGSILTLLLEKRHNLMKLGRNQSCRKKFVSPFQVDLCISKRENQHKTLDNSIQLYEFKCCRFVPCPCQTSNPMCNHKNVKNRYFDCHIALELHPDVQLPACKRQVFRHPFWLQSEIFFCQFTVGFISQSATVY